MSANGRPPPIAINDLAQRQCTEEANSVLDLVVEVGAILSFQPDALMTSAVERSGLDDFGPEDFVNRLDILCRFLRDVTLLVPPNGNTHTRRRRTHVPPEALATPFGLVVAGMTLSWQ